MTSPDRESASRLKTPDAETLRYKSLSLELGVGDITQEPSDVLITLINSSRMWFGGVDTAIQKTAGTDFHAIAAAYLDSNPVKDGDAIFADGSTVSRKRGFKNVIFVIDDLEAPLGQLVEAGLTEAYKRDLRLVTLPLMRSGVMAGVFEKGEDAVAVEMMNGMKSAVDKNPKKPLTAKIIVYSDRDGSRRNTLRTHAKLLLR